MLLRSLLAFACASSILFASPACDIPRDPDDTLDRVRGGVLRVGVIDNEPWTKRAGGEPTGVEVQLVREFAAELGARAHWMWGGEGEQMEALKRGELDLVIGGLTDETPWGAEVGTTNPYFESHIVVGVPPAMPPPASLEGLRVAVPQGDAIAARLEDENAIPSRTEDPFAANAPVAAAEWELEARGFTPTEFKLHTEKHIFATPPGENAFLVRLEEFLKRKRGAIKPMLRQEGETP